MFEKCRSKGKKKIRKIDSDIILYLQKDLMETVWLEVLIVEVCCFFNFVFYMFLFILCRGKENRKLYHLQI